METGRVCPGLNLIAVIRAFDLLGLEKVQKAQQQRPLSRRCIETCVDQRLYPKVILFADYLPESKEAPAKDEVGRSRRDSPGEIGE